MSLIDKFFQVQPEPIRAEKQKVVAVNVTTYRNIKDEAKSLRMTQGDFIASLFNFYLDAQQEEARNKCQN